MKKYIFIALIILSSVVLSGCASMETKEVWSKNGLADVTFQVESSYPLILEMVKSQITESLDMPDDVKIIEEDDSITIIRENYLPDNRTFESHWEFWNKVYTLEGKQYQVDSEELDSSEYSLGELDTFEVSTYIQFPCKVKEKSNCILVEKEGEDWYKCNDDFKIVSSCWLNLG
ncbi:hypothetical protein HN385_04940 [archaeon]|jgi:hypothetical protein|nr:hypothetical protein [archaeon]MBT4540811.1 hypothetical protein [Candidatus Woesearchaeota archaeon]MBT3465042.1 hypothetical protein [archaeon]MBT6869285.1 hypothetical protein [archaeon]MBT7381205.1 hypothetical protein [archaeon]